MKRATCLVVGFLAVTNGMANASREPARRIELAVPAGPTVFCTPIELVVRYHNTDTNSWIIPEPKGSSEVRLQLLGTNRKHPWSFKLAEDLVTENHSPDGFSVVTTSQRVGSPITVAENDSHRFRVLFEPVWLGRVTPGRWRVSISDGNLGNESNVVAVDLVFSTESVVACRSVAGDAANPVFERRWHAEYLKRIMPDLDLTRWRRGAEELSKEDREQMETEVKQEMDRFEAYWKDNANTAAIKEAIDKINLDAGLELERDATPGNAKPDGGTK